MFLCLVDFSFFELGKVNCFEFSLIRFEPNTHVLVCSRGGGGLLQEHMEFVAEFWEANVKAEFLPQKDPSFKEQYEYDTENDIKCLVIITEAGLSQGSLMKARIWQVHAGSKTANSPPGLFFQHAGHRDKVVDFHWNACDPWTIVSVSDDCGNTGGGGTLQIWCMSDLLHRPEEEVLADLEKFKAHILSCTSKLSATPECLHSLLLATRDILKFWKQIYLKKQNFPNSFFQRINILNETTRS